jgi:hypothetical protein
VTPCRPALSPSPAFVSIFKKESPMSKTHSRRVFLAAGPAASVFASLGAPARAEALSLDPIFAAIARHEATEARYCVACKLTDEIAAEQEGRAIAPANEAEFEAASAANDSALEALLATPPTTKAGARAGLDYFMSLEDGEALGNFAKALRYSQILAG